MMLMWWPSHRASSLGVFVWSFTLVFPFLIRRPLVFRKLSIFGFFPIAIFLVLSFLQCVFPLFQSMVKCSTPSCGSNIIEFYVCPRSMQFGGIERPRVEDKAYCVQMNHHVLRFLWDSPLSHNRPCFLNCTTTFVAIVLEVEDTFDVLNKKKHI